MLESMNNRLSEAREVTWLENLDRILTKMILQSANLQIIYKDDCGIIDGWNLNRNDRWKSCAVLNSYQISKSERAHIHGGTTNSAQECIKYK